MAEEVEEIEFLDEDADIVQQCVQKTNQPTTPTPAAAPTPAPVNKLSPEQRLLVERVATSTGRPRRKRKKEEEDDSDYDPSEDIPQRHKRKRAQPLKNITPMRRPGYAHKAYMNEMKRKEKVNRRNYNIRVPDFDDPLCLPVRAVVKDDNDVRRLRHWNHLCLEQFKSYDKLLRPKGSEAVSSRRVVVIRNLFNKQSGKTETTVWSKVSVDNGYGDTKADVVQSVLPRYREKKILNSFRLTKSNRPRAINTRTEVILTKELDGKEETLVGYKPDESLSMIFKMFEKDGEGDRDDEDQKRCLQEVASCGVCAPCYQTSWRGLQKNVTRNIHCQICMRPCISIYNLFTHLKSHTTAEVRRHKRRISAALAEALAYHYTCRICQKQFPTIRDLRIHVRSHKGLKPVYCEIGNHMVS